MFKAQYAKTTFQAFCEYLPKAMWRKGDEIWCCDEAPPNPNWWFIPANEPLNLSGEYYFEFLGSFFQEKPSDNATPFQDDQLHPERIVEQYATNENRKLSPNILFEMLELDGSFAEVYSKEVHIEDLVSSSDRCKICGTPFTYKTIQPRSGDEPSIDVVVCDNGHNKPSSKDMSEIPVFKSPKAVDPSLPEWYQLAISQL